MKNKLLPLLGALLLITNANAALTYQFNTVGVGTVAPVGPAPWLTFQVDEIDADSVQLTITSSLNASEFYSKVGINLNSSYDFSAPRTFSNLTQVGSFDLPVITSGNNIESLGAGTNYDLIFSFATSGSDGGSHHFDGNDVLSFRIDGVGIEGFETEETKNPAMAHIQNLTDGASSWLISTPFPTGTQLPEPSAALLGCVGTLTLLRRRR